MARLKKKVNLSIKGSSKKAQLDDDLYKSKDGTLRQKYDDNGHMNEEWRKILLGGGQKLAKAKTKKKK